MDCAMRLKRQPKQPGQPVPLAPLEPPLALGRYSDLGAGSALAAVRRNRSVRSNSLPNLMSTSQTKSLAEYEFGRSQAAVCRGRRLPSKPSTAPAAPQGLRPKTPNATWRRRTLEGLGSKAEASMQKAFSISSTDSLCSTEAVSESGASAAGGSPSSTPSRQASKESAVDRITQWVQSEANQAVRRLPCREKAAAVRRLRPRSQAKAAWEEDEAVALQALLPDIEAVAARLRADAGDALALGAQEQRLNMAFNRFRMQGSAEVHKGSLPQILELLGYPLAQEERLSELAEQVTRHSTLSFEELLDLESRFADVQRKQLKPLFDEFDADGSGSLDLEETVNLLKSMGYLYLQGAVMEIMSVVDVDGNGTLDCSEMALLLYLCHHIQGFTKEEVLQLSRCFRRQLARRTSERDQHSDGSELKIPFDLLDTVLKAFFGSASARRLHALEKEAAMLGGSGLTFLEVLAWAGKFRNQLLKDYSKVFEEADTRRSGTISIDVLQKALMHAGYTLSLPAIRELLSDMQQEGKWRDNWDLAAPCSEAFIHILFRLQQTDGFTAVELRELRATFLRFDEHATGDIDAVELNDILEDLGYKTKYDEVYLLIGQLIGSSTGKLDFRQYVRFMRMHRESELRRVSKVYEERRQPHMCLDKSAAQLAVADLSFDEKEDQVPPGVHNEVQALIDLHPGPIDLDTFVNLIDQIRLRISGELRKRAGFSQAEILFFQQLFDEQDKAGLGALSFIQVSQLLLALGLPMRTVFEREVVSRYLARARATCEGSGIAQKGETNLWCVVQLLRLLYRREDKRCMDRMREAAEECQYSVKEVAEFQGIFMSWWESSAVEQSDQNNKVLSLESLDKQFRNCGVKLEWRQKEALSRYLLELSDRGAVDFPDFMRLMRWMVDTDFAGFSKLR